MKALALENYGVQEMSESEASTAEGGSILGGILALAVVGVTLWGVADYIKDVVINREQFDMTEW